MAYTQEQVNAALAAELAARPNTPQADLTAYAKATYGLTDAQLNAAYDTIPGFNAQGQWDAADYIANRVPGTLDPQMVVNAANAVRDAEAAKNMEFLRTQTGQHSVVDPTTGQTKQLNPFNPDFNPNDPYTLAMLGSQVLAGDTNANIFFSMNPQYRPLADAAWAKEKARLNASSGQEGLLTTTGQTTQTGQATKTYTPAETAVYNAYRAGDIAGTNRAIQEGKLTAGDMQAKFGLTNDEMSWMTNNAGVKFYTPTTAVTTGVTTGGTTGLTGGTNVGGKTYTQAETDLYNAYRAGNIAEFNRLAAANKLTAGDMQSKFGLSQGEMNWITNNAGGKFYSPTDTTGTVTNTGGLGGLGGVGGIAQNFANYQSIPIGAQYNPNVTVGGASPYSQIMGQMRPFSNPYAGMAVNQPMGGYNPGLYDQIAAANLAKTAAENAATTAATQTGMEQSSTGGMAKGGMVDGGLMFGMNPPGPDDGAVNLDLGEYVIKKSSVNKYGKGLLDMINEGKVPAKKLKSLLG
jgi:hypothetical protein